MEEKKDAIQMLLHDHGEVGELYSQYIGADEEDHEKRQSIAEKIIEELEHHFDKEQKVLFPEYVKSDGDEAEDLVLHALEEHQIGEFIIERLEKSRPDYKTYEAKFKTLMESIKHHFIFEELELFPKAKKALSDELERLGEEMKELKKEE